MSKALELAEELEKLSELRMPLTGYGVTILLRYSALELRRLAEIERKYNELYFFNEISVRAKNCLVFEGIKTLDDVISKTYQELLRIPNFHRESLKEVYKVLKSIGLELNGNKPSWIKD